jgi:hypothetical protein
VKRISRALDETRLFFVPVADLRVFGVDEDGADACILTDIERRPLESIL